MKYFFAELVNEFNETHFLGGSPVVKGAQEVASKHAIRNKIDPISKWSKGDPSTATPAGSPAQQYRVYSKDVPVSDATK